jgi:hypothetical protein
VGWAVVSSLMLHLHLIHITLEPRFIMACTVDSKTNEKCSKYELSL